MKPLRHPLLPDGRGHRSVALLAALADRDRLLCEAAARFCVGMSGREAARYLHSALARYRAGAWQRTRVEATCPARHAGRIDELLWAILKSRDATPSETLIRAALAR